MTEAPEKQPRGDKPITSFRISRTARQQLKELSARRNIPMGDLLAQLIDAEYQRDEKQRRVSQ